MNLFDWFLIAILAYSTIVAFFRGIIRELFSLGGLIVGILIASWNYNRLAIYLQRLIATPSIAEMVSFFLLVIGVMVLSALLGRALNRTAHAIGLGFFDRILGAVFGFARGCLLGVAILMAIAAFSPHPPWIKNSQLSSYFLAGAHAVSFVVPHDLQQRILDGAAQLKHNAPNWIKPLR
ncbi:CvpA family protein [Tunturibacter empetritectus]|uniref:Membrane protein required for colicin V production n=1 Tax=Tunturiibacter empetritectus TaxID=3069691 RepID=A0A7W8IIX6_9BACT|nr:CvpA family protein [Edaphobacter lichenicola]MBB5317994.1 membrane protein required for colicin V production [Edaphobacter lichenicola]